MQRDFDTLIAYGYSCRTVVPKFPFSVKHLWFPTKHKKLKKEQQNPHLLNKGRDNSWDDRRAEERQLDMGMRHIRSFIHSLIPYENL